MTMPRSASRFLFMYGLFGSRFESFIDAFLGELRTLYSHSFLPLSSAFKSSSVKSFSTLIALYPPSPSPSRLSNRWCFVFSLLKLTLKLYRLLYSSFSWSVLYVTWVFIDFSCFLIFSSYFYPPILLQNSSYLLLPVWICDCTSLL